MYRYETHLHTLPVSKCAKATVRENLEFYKRMGYDGVFVTNHFLDGNIGINKKKFTYEEQLDFYMGDYDEAVSIGRELGLKVFFGVEMAYQGTDFLIYGLDREFYYAHPEIMCMEKKGELEFLARHGAFIVHAHPFREANYIPHIRLYPRSIHAVETLNACRTELENRMAALYAENYGFPVTGGTDNHKAAGQRLLAGVECEAPLTSVADYIEAVKTGTAKIFTMENPEYTEE